MHSTLIVGVNCNYLVAPEMCSGELSSCADNGYLLLKFFSEIHLLFLFLFPPPGSVFVASLSEKQVIDLVWPKDNLTIIIIIKYIDCI